MKKYIVKCNEGYYVGATAFPFSNDINLAKTYSLISDANHRANLLKMYGNSEIITVNVEIKII